MRKIFGILTVFVICISCKQNRPLYTRFLNTDSLPSQRITIDNTKDTTLKTANGAVINIVKGSFSKESVELEIKEAYTPEQMILAGLTTMSDGRPLSSGGMIYIDATNDAEIIKPLQVSIPTDVYDSKMQLYKGEEENGTINWTDPEPMGNKDSMNTYFANGKQLFKNYCGSCHGLEQAISGPALSGVEGRGPWDDRNKLVEFTRNAPAYIQKSCYVQELQKQYGSIMPSFQSVKEENSHSEGGLSDDDIVAIYDYIRNEDIKKGITYTNNYAACEDSCYVYDSLRQVLAGSEFIREKLIDSNEARIDFEWNMPGVSSVDADGDLIPPPDTNKVAPVRYQAVYYKFEMKSFGWYNVDHLLNGKTGQSELVVAVQGVYRDNMNVFIVVPERKIFGEGGPLKGEKDLFGFFATDGTIPLPEGNEVIVFAVGESEGEIVFDYKKFTSTSKQTITLEPKKVSKKQFNKIVSRFRLKDVDIKADDSKNASEIRKTDDEIKKNSGLLEKYRPKNCDCNCGKVADTAIKLPAVAEFDYLDTNN